MLNRKPQIPLDTYLGVHKKANDHTIPATFKRGIVSAINIQSGTMDVQIIGNQTTVLKGIQISSAVNIYTARIGDKCRIDFFDETNPNDAVVAYTYGRSGPQYQLA